MDLIWPIHFRKFSEKMEFRLYMRQSFAAIGYIPSEINTLL